MNSDPTRAELLDLLEQSREYTLYLAELGVETIALSSKRTASLSTVPAVHLPGPTTTVRPPASSAEEDQSLSRAALFARPPATLFAEPVTSQSKESMEDIWRDIGDCTRCGLCEGRTQVVNTFGNHKARLMFVGEAPGADEDAQGRPFVGRAGQLLTKIIEAIGLKREEVLIGNVNRCRPPGNRQPTLEEAAICRPFLFREIAAVKPDVIVVMGNTALRNLLEVREGITRVRGKFQDFRGIKVMPTFHPAYLLRDPSKKRETWEDLKKVRDYLDNLPPRAA
ncbi:MAG: uracil-DNA glycosylase [Blastocatellia bacterium]|jgi:DNA polymerase|nr:uracil-DNA glycosylase [Blastocatellia bacterium]